MAKKKLYKMEELPPTRFSSRGPNIQDIRKPTEEFRKLKSAFITDKQFDSLASADYSKIEQHILSHMTVHPWRLAVSAPFQNPEGRWIFAYIQEIWDTTPFKVKTRSFIFHTLGMDGITGDNYD